MKVEWRWTRDRIPILMLDVIFTHDGYRMFSTPAWSIDLRRPVFPR